MPFGMIECDWSRDGCIRWGDNHRRRRGSFEGYSKGLMCQGTKVV